MIVLIGHCGNILQVPDSWRQKQITAREPQTGSGGNACRDLGIIGTPAQAVK
jgi:hypothetical protein